MSHRARVIFILSSLLLFSLACNLASGAGGAAQATPGTAQEQTAPQTQAAVSAEDEVLYFAAFPVEVTDSTGKLKVLAARALKNKQQLDIVVVLENISTDPLDIFENLVWQARAIDASGAAIGQEGPITEDLGLPPGHRGFLVAFVMTWQGEVDHFSLEITGGKTRFIQEDMQGKFRDLALPNPLFRVVEQPFTFLDETFLGRKVIRTQQQAVIHNPNPGPAKEVVSRAVYYDAGGQIVGFAHGALVDIPGQGETPTEFNGVAYFSGDPVRAEFFTNMDPYYLEELFGLW